ncbi:MAG: membrane-bound lytic murein transglycosylase F, partial [Cryomorphaceae bacterium]
NWRKMHWSAIERNLINDPIELIGETVSVRQNSSYFARIKNLSDEIGGEIYIDTLPGRLSTDEIIQMVVNGEIEYTVSDNNIAAINASYYPILDIEVPISFSQRIAWAVDKNSNDLLDSMNEWIGEMKKHSDYYVIYNKYFKNKRDFRRRVKSEFYSINNNRISEFDPLIQKYAHEIGWDWRLLASLVYQESRFEPNASSWSEAEGLMQIMPATADDLGIENRSDPEQSIKGGTEYLSQLYRNFEDLPDSLDRIKFTMASFNAGLGHVEDAQRLALKRGLKPNVWEDNVEKMILALSYPKNFSDPVVKYGYVRGIEPFTYVGQIFERYGHYSQFIDRELSNFALN